MSKDAFDRLGDDEKFRRLADSANYLSVTVENLKARLRTAEDRITVLEDENKRLKTEQDTRP